MLLLQAGTAAARNPVDAQRALVQDAVAPCRRGRRGEIVVCGRSKDERSPYRLPVIDGEDGFQIDGPVDSVSRGRHKLMDVGGAGSQQNSCGATGSGGLYGCQVKAWKEADQQRGFARPKRR